MSARRRRTKSGSKEESENLDSGYGYPVNNTGKTFIESKDISLDSVDMSCRDRTGEFLSAVKSLQSRQVSSLFNDFFILDIMEL